MPLALIPAALMWLARFLSTTVLAYFGRKAFTIVTTIGFFAAFSATFIACILGLIRVLQQIPMPTGVFAQGLGLFIPSNFELVITSILTAFACRFAYDLAMDKVRTANSAT
jgi:hypothetical protein